MQTKPRRAGVVFETNLEACGGTLVLLQDPADLSVHRRRVEAPLGAADAAGKAGEGGFNAAAEFVVDRLLFAAPFSRAAQDDGLSPVSRQWVSLTSMPSRILRQPSGAASGDANLFSSDFGAPMM